MRRQGDSGGLMRYDAIIIGAEHNGLTNAACLARAAERRRLGEPVG